jgi:hypothetical protein
MSEVFRVLVLDDISAFAFAIDGMLRSAPELLPRPPEIVPARDVAAVEALLARGVHFDVAIVDLGLGAGARSGLGAVSALEACGVPLAIHTDYQEATRRLMFIYAAFTWYRPIALMPKTETSPGRDLRTVQRDFARNVAAVAQRIAPSPDQAAPFRPRIGRDDPFSRVLNTPEDLRNWQMFVNYSSTAAVARAANVSAKTIEKFVAAKYEPVADLLTAATAAGIDTVFGMPGSNDGANVDRQGAIHRFAMAQSWFFTDPVVIDRYQRR